jgi:transposase
MPVATEGLDLDSKAIASLPIINHYLERLNVAKLLRQFVSPGRANCLLQPVEALMIMLRNLIIARQPTYEVSEWGRRYEPNYLGLGKRAAKALNDDRLGRALDALFLADRATMQTKLTLHAIKEFNIETRRFHNDATSVKCTGRYHTRQSHRGKAAVIPKRGHSKDHRPDLKQIVFTLTVCADGAVPVHFKAYDGNITDDQTHIETWNAIARLKGDTNFTYVADCKLCTKEQMTHIAGNSGKFITVMPRSRKEDQTFRELLRAATIEWQEWIRKPDPRDESKEHVYYGYESPTPSAEGFRIVWIKSTQKQAHDAETRQDRIQATLKSLAKLKSEIECGRSRARDQVESVVKKILAEHNSAQWFDWDICSTETILFKQIGHGRPGKDTKYDRFTKTRWSFNALPSYQRIKDDATDDGIFPLITNHESEEVAGIEVLKMYKYQPFLEKRHEQLKSVLDVAPAYFKLPHRIEALLFMEFLALMITALIERELRLQMTKRKIGSLPLYPEARKCKHPTTDRIITVFEPLQRHILMFHDKEVKTFHDSLSPLQFLILDLLGVSTEAYTT